MNKINKSQNLKAILLALLFFSVVLPLQLTFVKNVSAQTTPIPAGCPGSSQQGPPAPGVCEAIPAGCPGSTQAGPTAPNTTCPYAPASQGQAPQSGNQGSIGSSGQGTLQTDCDVPPSVELSPENCKIIEYLVTGINVLSALAGMAIVASIMFAGYQYMTARDNPGQISQARMRIVWALVALLLFIFMYALLNFLVPGGVL